MKVDETPEPSYKDVEQKSESIQQMEKGNKEIRKASGSINIVGENAKLIAFMYTLMRDRIPVGEMERFVREIRDDVEYEFCNGWLAQYSEYLVKKLTTVEMPEKKEKK